MVTPWQDHEKILLFLFAAEFLPMPVSFVCLCVLLGDDDGLHVCCYCEFNVRFVSWLKSYINSFQNSYFLIIGSNIGNEIFVLSDWLALLVYLYVVFKLSSGLIWGVLSIARSRHYRTISVTWCCENLIICRLQLWLANSLNEKQNNKRLYVCSIKITEIHIHV